MRRILGAAAMVLGLVVSVAACADESKAATADLRAFVPMGTLQADLVDVGGPVWLDGDAATDLADALEAEELDEAADALGTKPRPGTRGAAFVLVGCAETGAKLTIEDGTISAELTGNENVMCDAAAYFLAVFDIPEDRIP